MKIFIILVALAVGLEATNRGRNRGRIRYGGRQLSLPAQFEGKHRLKHN